MGVGMSGPSYEILLNAVELACVLHYTLTGEFFR